MIIKHYLSGPLSVNTYLVIDEGSKEAFIVDPGGVNTNLVQFVEDEELDVKYILLTHGHGDHIGGVAAYQQQFPQIKVVASAEELPILGNARMNASFEISGVASTVEPDILVTDGETLTMGALTMKFLATPGHTPGGLCILVDDILFSGDTLFEQSIGRTDLPGGSFADIKTSIHQKLFTLPAQTKVLPGHMGETTIGFEKEHNPFV